MTAAHRTPSPKVQAVMDRLQTHRSEAYRLREKIRSHKDAWFEACEYAGLSLTEADAGWNKSDIKAKLEKRLERDR